MLKQLQMKVPQAEITQAEVTQSGPDRYIISGVLDFSTVPDLLRQMSVFFKGIKQGIKQDVKQGHEVNDPAIKEQNIIVDLSEVTVCNSAALALLLEIARDASSNNFKIHFNHLPETLLTIAKAYGAESEIREITQ